MEERVLPFLASLEWVEADAVDSELFELISGQFKGGSGLNGADQGGVQGGIAGAFQYHQ